MAKCNQFTSLPFKGLANEAFYSWGQKKLLRRLTTQRVVV